MKLNDKRYFLIFDTNILHKSYKSQADFTTFSLNTAFYNCIEMINKLDIYERVEVAIPVVVWNELKKQIIDAHDKQILEYQKWKFPEYHVKCLQGLNYINYIDEQINEYKDNISSGINKILELPVPNNKCFTRIVERAFEKKAPFEGKDKNSDKGFKDVLIWESILELVEINPKSKIIFYSQDKGFEERLKIEFKDLYPKSTINICSTREDVKKQLQDWAKEIDEYSYLPIEEIDEEQKFSQWIKSSDFTTQLININWDIVEKSRLVKNVSMHLVAYDNVEMFDENDNEMLFRFEVKIKNIYNLYDGGSTEEIININVEAEYDYDDKFNILSVGKINE